MGYIREPSYVLQACLSNVSPSDSSSYLIGNPSYLTTTGYFVQIYIPRSGIIRHVYVRWFHTTQDCTAEDTSFYIRKNNTTDSGAIYTGTMENAAGVQSVSNLNFAVSEGDYIHLKMVTPAWVTNPTGTYITSTIEIT